jgi:Mn-dependent DtxR family transcriptional regulator
MGRVREPLQPLDVEIIQQAFALRHDGQIVRCDCHISHLTGEPATFAGPGGKLLVRVYIGGKIRRVLATRIAWVLATGQWPDGPVLPRNGDDNDLRFENLLKVRHGRDPFGRISDKHSRGGRASALVHRGEADRAMIAALAEHDGSLTVPQLSVSVGQSAPCCCARLAKLERRGLVCGPHCNARRRWDLTEQGRALAATTQPVILDDRDRQVLGVLALASMGTLKLARRVEVCPATIKRRVRVLVERGLVFADPRRFFSITSEGRLALGDDMPQRQPWVRTELVSAALSRDVLQRHDRPPDDRSAQFRSKVASMGAAKSIEAQRLSKRRRFAFGDLADLDRMTG